MLNAGDKLKDRYKVTSVIGRGGMSTVYLVEDLVLQSRWAMKETRDIFPDRDKKEMLSQFKREAKILANLSHRGLPRVIDYFTENNNHYLVEEFIDGKPAEEIAAAWRFPDEARILDWAVKICQLLEFLHGNSIIYRDLKPGNILVDDKEEVYLVDFGIARFFQGGKARDTVIIGTPGFASPEHYGRGETDRRSDIFSLGATLHFLLTGIDPADKPFHFDIPYQVNPKLSFQTSSIVMKCLDLDPNRRFQNASLVREAIEKRAMPGLSRNTRPLEATQPLRSAQNYRTRSDFMGRTAKFLSYTSVFPASMGISGLVTLGVSVFGPVPAFLAGVISFPLLCAEFWKRLDQVYLDEHSLVTVAPGGIAYRSRSINVGTPWKEVVELRLVKNSSPFSMAKIKKVIVKTLSGTFSFDSSIKNHRQLIDTIITQGELFLMDDGKQESVYVRR